MEGLFRNLIGQFKQAFGVVSQMTDSTEGRFAGRALLVISCGKARLFIILIQQPLVSRPCP